MNRTNRAAELHSRPASAQVARAASLALLAAAGTIACSAPGRAQEAPVDSLAADATVVAIAEVRTIESPGGDRRILFRPGDLSRFVGELVLSASLEIPLARTAISRSVDLRVYPMTREWTSGATWNSPWTREGGDIDENYVPTGRLEAGDGRVSSVFLDVTSIVRAWADSELAKNGLVLCIPPAQGDGLDSEAVGAFADLAGATIHVDYRKISGLGFQGGSRALDGKDPGPATREE